MSRAASADFARPDYRVRGTWLHLGLLAIAAIILSIGTSIVFAPGGMNPDTRWQLHQVLGNEPLSDWHPAIMTITWMWLHELTGHASAVLYAQVLVMFGAGFGFAVYLFDVTRSRAWSYAGLFMLLAPHLFTFIGVLWKDTQMAEAFFLAVVCALLASRFTTMRWLFLAVGLIALTYGTAVRKNAFFAVLPLVYLMAALVYSGSMRRAGQSLLRRLTDVRFLGLTAALLALVIGTGAVLNAIYQPLKTHQVSQVMLDDVIFSVPREELKQADIDAALKEKLLEAQRICAQQGDYEDAYWRCYGRGADGIYTAIEHVDELKEAWVRTVLTRPDRYLLYRTQTFAHLLFDNSTDWNGQTEENSVGWETKYKQANDAAQTYVEKFGVRDMPWLFTGWFWLASPIILLCAHRHVRRLGRASGWPELSTAVSSLSISAAVYIVGYFPIVPANHFRYVYWPALAGTMCLVMLGAAGARAWRSRRCERREPEAAVASTSQ